MDHSEGKSITNRLATSNDEIIWNCHACTFEHVGKSKKEYLSCELCGTKRRKNNGNASKASSVEAMPIKKKHTVSSSWGSLRPPSSKDIQPRKRRKGLDAPPPMMNYLIVLDFEWTADNSRKMLPAAEITQFPSVCMRLLGGKEAASIDNNGNSHTDERIPGDLMSCPSSTGLRRDALAVAVFDSFVRPIWNPTLTQFSIDLTAITQGMVDAAPTLPNVLKNYLQWLESLGLIDEDGNRIGNWAFCTWGDMDIMSTLRLELHYKSIKLPSCFDRWINLKDDSMFKKHFRREPRGGLKSCVESVGANWGGRAHNGLVDSFNTAKIVRRMVQTGFQFTRTTRGLDKNGIPFGQKQVVQHNKLV